MSSEVIRKLALQQLKEEELKKKEEEIQQAVAAEVERLRSRATTEIVKDDLSELRNEIQNLKDRINYLENKVSNNPLERKVLELATYVGDPALSFRLKNGINKRKFCSSFQLIDGHGNPNNWSSGLYIGNNCFSFSTDISKRMFQFRESLPNIPQRLYDYTFTEVGIESYSNKTYEITLEITQEKIHIQIGNLRYSRDLPRKYSIDELFEPGFINMSHIFGYAFKECY